MTITYQELLAMFSEKKQRRIKRGVQRLNAKYKKLNAEEEAARRTGKTADGPASDTGDSPVAND